jgi:hypothetical protein
VPETLLWNLYYRALEARRPDAVLRDPKAVELVDAIDYPLEERFGVGHPRQAQGQALRVLCFDQEIRRFLSVHPEGTVITLGEGLETQFWRVDNGRVRWLTVDLPGTVEVRRRLLPESPRQRTLACSAQGLLMYLRPSEVRTLIAICPRRLPDAVPHWFSARTMRGEIRTSGGYRPPPMPWGMDADEPEKIRAAHPNVVEERELHLPRGRGLFWGYLTPLLNLVPVVHNKRLSVLVGGQLQTVVLVRFCTSSSDRSQRGEQTLGAMGR